MSHRKRVEQRAARSKGHEKANQHDNCNTFIVLASSAGRFHDQPLHLTLHMPPRAPLTRMSTILYNFDTS